MTLSMKRPVSFTRTYDEKADTWRITRVDFGSVKQATIVENAFMEYGLSRNEARAYLYLAKAGEKKAAEIAEAISIHRTETYKILRSLEKKGVVLSTFEKPLKFAPIPLDRAVEHLVEEHRTRVKLLERKKGDLIKLWSLMPKTRIEDRKKESFQILEGKLQVIQKANELLAKAHDEIQILAPDKYLTILHNSDFIENFGEHSLNLSVELLTENSLKARLFCQQIGWANHGHCIDRLDCLPCLVVADRTEALIIDCRHRQIGQGEAKKKPSIMAVLTNYSAIVGMASMLFLKLAGHSGVSNHVHLTQQ